VKLNPGRWLLLIAWGVLAAALFNAGIGFWALKRVEKKAGTPIRGVFLPHLFQPVFTLKDPWISWQDRFQVVSGHLRVRYEPLSLLPGRKLRVQIWGSELTVHLLGKWKESQGFSEARVDTVEADFALPDKGPPEIFAFHLNSPELQFNLTEK